MNASIDTPSSRCRRECCRTFRYEYGDALPGGPFPGTNGMSGDVRRCEHGRIWEYEPTIGYHHGIDTWTELTWWTPIRYRRAVLALRGSCGMEEPA